MHDIKKRKTYNILYTTSFSTMAGGGQWSLYYLIKHLNRDRFHPLVLCPEEGELAQTMRGVGAEPVFIKIGRIRNLSPITCQQIMSVIKERKIDLIHTDSTTETFYGGTAAKIMRIPLIWHIRVSMGGWFTDRMLALLATKLILVANILRKRFSWLDEAESPVIYNAIDLGEFDSAGSASSVREEFGIGRETVVLACVGRIEEKKGQEYLVSAMNRIPNAKLLLAGRADEMYVKRIKVLCEKYGLTDRVILTGRRDDIPALLGSIDIFVFPTLTEAFSRVILEAMAAAKPVVATDAGGNREAVIDNVTGYIVRTKDPEALSERVNDLIRNKEKRNQMGLAGRKRVESEFDIRHTTGQIEDIYREILEER